jgi:hypothetical protein
LFAKKSVKAFEVMEASYLNDDSILQETVLDIKEINTQEYNFFKILDKYFVPIEETEKKSLANEVKISREIDGIRRIKSSPYQPLSVEELRTKLKKQRWEEILDMTNRLIYHLGNDVLPQFINLLVLATDDLNTEVRTNHYLFSVFSALSIYYKDIMVYHALRQKIEAIKRAQRSKEILEFGIQINDVIRREGLKPIETSEFEKIDEIEGKSIYTFKQ